MADRVAEFLFIIDEFLRELDGARDDIRDPDATQNYTVPSLSTRQKTFSMRLRDCLPSSRGGCEEL